MEPRKEMTVAIFLILLNFKGLFKKLMTTTIITPSEHSRIFGELPELLAASTSTLTRLHSSIKASKKINDEVIELLRFFHNHCLSLSLSLSLSLFILLYLSLSYLIYVIVAYYNMFRVF